MQLQSNPQSTGRLILKWIFALFVFFFAYGLMAGFLNALLTDALQIAFVSQGSPGSGKYTLIWIAIVFGEIFLVDFVLRYVLKLFPSPITFARIILGLSIFALVVSLSTNGPSYKPGALAGMAYSVAVILTMGERILAYKNKS